MNTLPPSTPPFARIVNSLVSAQSQLDYDPYIRARTQIPGWSTPSHFTFFGHVLAALPAGARVLVCGVYHGLDLALLQAAARLLHKEIHLTGVDLFSDQPCADWPPGKRHLTWQQAFDCPPPSLDAALSNAPGASIVQGDAFLLLSTTTERFDFIYLDTSHDEQTVRREIAAAVPRLTPGGLLAGDDYHQPGMPWGVDRAVSDLLPHHAVFFNRIWLAQP